MFVGYNFVRIMVRNLQQIGSSSSIGWYKGFSSVVHIIIIIIIIIDGRIVIIDRGWNVLFGKVVRYDDGVVVVVVGIDTTRPNVLYQLSIGRGSRRPEKSQHHKRKRGGNR